MAEKRNIKPKHRKKSLRKWKKIFIERHQREPSIIEYEIFATAFNMGWQSYKEKPYSQSNEKTEGK